MQRTMIGALGAAVALAAGMAQSAPPPKPAVQAVAIVGATVFDGTGAAPHAATVVIVDGRIAAVGPKPAIPRGAKIIDAKGEALLPGFIDVHTHWTPGGVPATTPQIANAYLASGVTTTDDFNSSPEAFAARRQWLSMLAAPHVNMTARMSVPGGHGADWADRTTAKWLQGPEDARVQLRAVLAYKPDLVKGFQDGWRYGSGADNNSMDQATLSALVDEAHRNQLKVLTHTVTVARGKEAARAKVDVIAHSLQDAEVDQETVDLMKANGTAYAPTLAVYEPVKPGQKAPPETDPRLRVSRAKFANALHNVKRLADAGVTIALGTDAGMPGTPHGPSTLREMELLVQAGLTPAQALLAGTANSARVIGLGDDRGTIEPGKRADLVLLTGTPWTDIADVRKTDRVFVDGRLVYGPGAVVPAANSQTSLPPTPAAAKIDDFERPDGRTSVDTLRIEDFDRGSARSTEVSQVVTRGTGDHALLVTAAFATKSDPYAGVALPLNRGSLQPADARAFQGVTLDVRGAEGTVLVTVTTLSGRWTAKVPVGDGWKTVKAPFADLKPEGGRGVWRGDDLLEVGVVAGGAAGRATWMEVDNVGFY